jgi:hypothetical protein
MSGKQQQRRRYNMSRAVRDAIGGGAAADVLAGRASPARYQCVMCDTEADARRDQTSVIVMRQGPADILAYAHASCLPSQVTTFEAVTAARQAAGTPEPPPTPSDVILGWYGPYPALIADEPAVPALLTADGPVNLSLGAWLSQGFTVATPDTIPPRLPDGWSARLAGSTLHGITSPPDGGWWWKTDTAGQAVRLPAEWTQVARQQGGVVILAGDIGLGDATTSQQFGDTITAAIAAGRVAYGLAPLTAG